MKICKVCGRAMDDNYNVCPYCGTVPGDARDDSQQTEPQQSDMGYNAPPQYQAPPLRNDINQKNEPPEYTPAPRPQRSAYVAAILAVFLGAFGVHNFYLDRKNRALMQLLIAVIGAALTFGVATLAMEVWAVIEGVKILKGEINTDGTGNMIKMGL